MGNHATTLIRSVIDDFGPRDDKDCLSTYEGSIDLCLVESLLYGVGD